MRRRESAPIHPDHPRETGRREALLAALRSAERPLTVAEAAAAIGTVESTARFHLSILVSAGRVVRTPVRSGSAGRPSWQYAAPAAAAQASTGPSAYQELARVLAAQMAAGVGTADAALEAGRRWAETAPSGRLRSATNQSEALSSLHDALAGLGFAPELRPEDREVVLHACPFEAVAREHRAVVCGVHRGLAERTAAAIGGGISVDGLEPFRSEEPLSCALRLRFTT